MAKRRTALDKKRDEIKAVYPSWKWDEKVDNMKPAQVIAIWNSFKESGRLKPRKLTLGRNSKEPMFRQMTIWDFIPKEENNG